MASSLFKKIMETVGSGFGTDYNNLGVRVEGDVAYVFGSAGEQKIINEYVEKVNSTDGVSKVIVEAEVRAE